MIGAVAVLAACTEPPPPRSVEEFLRNPIMLEAALVRCSQNRSESRYEAECMNAREANKQVAAGEEARRREEFEKQSERKRQALRRAQEAAAEARRRAEEARRLRQEAEYLAQFGELPPDAEARDEDVAGGNEPGAVIAPAPSPARQENPIEPLAAPPDSRSDEPSAAADAPGDLEAVREELRRRNEE